MRRRRVVCILSALSAVTAYQGMLLLSCVCGFCACSGSADTDSDSKTGKSIEAVAANQNVPHFTAPQRQGPKQPFHEFEKAPRHDGLPKLEGRLNKETMGVEGAQRVERLRKQKEESEAVRAPLPEIKVAPGIVEKQQAYLAAVEAVRSELLALPDAERDARIRALKSSHLPEDGAK
jgi:hypothetical protein